MLEFPYAPYQICPTAYPKQKIRAKPFYSPYKVFSSCCELGLKKPTAWTNWIIQPAEMIGEIPSSIKVPLLEANMTLVQ